MGCTPSERKQVEQAGLFTSLWESLSVSPCRKFASVTDSRSRRRSHRGGTDLRKKNQTMAVNKCIKCLLFFFNVLFWISGCIILAVSIYLKVNKDGGSIASESVPGVDLMIAIGVIIMVLGFLGCCGAIRENRCMLLVFFIGLLLIFILLLAAGILGAVGSSQVKDWLRERLQKLTPLSDQPQSVRDDIEKLQQALYCCGLVNGPSDWATVPSSCRCNSTVTDCTPGTNYQTPCSTKIGELMAKSMNIVLGIAFAIAILLIFGMAFAMILYCQIGKKDSATRPTTNA